MPEDSETELHPSGLSSGSSAIDGGRFVPGTILDARYRIVALLGRGGMGEVYRAEDLKLGETVALKFLPESLGEDGAALARFHREVRTARGVAHPNVVRVHDIGEQDGQPFLSMEYVDGEDLSLLLKRIGHLPAKKGVELARQLCAGLAAAHAAGVVHRDLKPANVMVDSEGRAKISDFGLASLAETDLADGSGTPQYMAPEQLEGGRFSFASDIYSLGLVLYELFTGERPFRAASREDLIDQQRSGELSTPSSHVETLDPLVERVILQCLAQEPDDRPASALQVAAGLPGGDPLAAAMAAGETPSPEMVARAAVPGALARPKAWALLATALVSIVVTLALADRQSMLQLDGLPLKPEVLEHKALALLEDIGWHEDSRGLGAFRLADSVFRLAAETRPREEWAELASDRSTFVEYLYRAGPGGVSPIQRWHSGVSATDPPPTLPGMVTVTLDSRGRLRELLAVPSSGSLDTVEAAGTDWSPLFAAAELDPAGWEVIDPSRAPPIYADSLVAWAGTYPDQQERVVIEAAARAGRAVSWRVRDAEELEQIAPVSTGAVGFALMMFAAMLVVAAWQAVRNLRSGRGDRQGSLRIAVVAGLAALINDLARLLTVSSGGSLSLYLAVLAESVFISAAVWLVYMAIEPLMRRHHPRGLVSWSRVLAGRFADPLVGRDVLVGLAFVGLFQTLNFGLNEWMLGSAGDGDLFGGYPHGLNALLGPGRVIGNLFSIIQIVLPLGLMFLYVAPRLVVSNTRLATALGVVAVFTFCVAFEGVGVRGFLNGAFVVLVVSRVGFVGMVALSIFMNNLILSPATLDASAWWAYNSWIGVGVVVALAVWSFRTTAAQPATEI